MFIGLVIQSGSCRVTHFLKNSSVLYNKTTTKVTVEFPKLIQNAHVSYQINIKILRSKNCDFKSGVYSISTKDLVVSGRFTAI
jgi:type IV secretory pathway VirB4 component